MLSHVWFCNPMDCSPPGSSVHGIHTFRPPLLLASSFLSLPPPCLYLQCLTLDHSWPGLIKWDFLFNIFCNSLTRILINFSLNVWQNSPMKPSDPGCLFVGSCLIIDLIFFNSVQSIQIFYFFQFSLERVYISRNLSFYSRLSSLLT